MGLSMSDALDFSFDELDGSGSALKAVSQQLAQGIYCHPFHIALPYSWSTNIVEEFELVAVPKSAPWMAGITNVAGVILPVVDLSVFFSPQLQPKPISRQHRLLVGGDLATDTNDSEAVPMALLFERLPNQVRSARRLVSDPASLPPFLEQVCLGELADGSGQFYFEICPEQLTRALLQAL